MRYGVTYTNSDGEYTIMQTGYKRRAIACFERYSHINGVSIKYMVRRKGLTRRLGYTWQILNPENF